VQGLLHVSEMGWSRVPDIREIVREGDEVTVKVLRVDEDGGRIALGLKQLQEDPWATIGSRCEVGRVVSGRVSRHAQFGAFVEIEPGVEGLAHVSTFAAAGKGAAWQKALPVGAVAAFEVVSLEPEKKRVALALVPEGTSRAASVAPDAADAREYAEREQAAATENFGATLGDKLRGALEPRER
jgi:small subunit ribosomal protein S1